MISPKYCIKMVNVTLMSFKIGLHIESSQPKNCSFPIDILIENCTFVDNIYDTILTFYDPTSVKLFIRNTRFISSNHTVEVFQKKKNYAISLTIPLLENITSTKAVIELENNVFHYRPPSYFSLLFEGEKNVTIRRSHFRNCISAYGRQWINKKSGYFYQKITGAIAVLFSPDKPQRLGCMNSHMSQEVHPSWTNNSRILFEDTNFEDNFGVAVGAVYISNGFATFRRCIFRNNFGIQRAGHVYCAYGTGRIYLVDCSFFRTKKNVTLGNMAASKTGTFIYSESAGSLKLVNTSMMSTVTNRSTYPILDIASGGFVDIDQNSEIKCSEGQKLLLENNTHLQYTEKNKSACILNVTSLRYSCRSCSPGYYSLERGTSRGLVVANHVKCLPCPFGAICIENNIAAKPNFWGYLKSTHSQSLEFLACPEDYCPSIATKYYNICQGNRVGTLCGQCAKGFTETLFSTECRNSTKCGNYTVWIVTMALTITLALYLLIKPPILIALRNQIFWFINSKQNQEEDNLNTFDDGEHTDGGYLKITFYFYQAAETVMVGSMDELIGKIPFIHFVISVYNFHVQSVNESLGCPFAGLSAVTKELLLSSTVFMTMANVFLIYGVHYVVNVVMGKEKPSLIHYMAVVMEVLLLGYESLAETALRLMNCVSIGSGKWLFIDANVPCMQWWQYLLLAYIAIFLIPFIIVLYYGSYKLQRSSTTGAEFIAACMIPLPFLIYWFIKKLLKRPRQESTRVQIVNPDILEILHGPFRPPSGNDEGTLYWESVLIGRRFILLVFKVFIADMMLRMVSMATACLLITIHHISRNPYHSPLANKAETCSLAALTVMSIINLAKATLISFGITISGPGKSYMAALEWLEVSFLAFAPALVSLLVAFAVLSQLVRLLRFLTSRLRYCFSIFCSCTLDRDQERRPLLHVADQR